MRKNVLLAAALLGLSLPAPAVALKTSVIYRVSIDGDGAGSWSVRGLVQDIGFACRYIVRWRSGCTIDEFKASANIDCDEAKRRFFNTGIAKADGEPCGGEDESGQRARIILLQGGESSSGRINGVIQIASVGDMQILYVRPR